jgi:phosphoribosylglycinamide formyltransferase
MAEQSSATSSTRVTVLISGSGTNLQALINASPTSSPAYHIVRVISNRKAAFGLTRAVQSGIPVAYHNLVTYKRKHPLSEDTARREYDTDLAALILEDKPELVVCAGFMHVLSTAFLSPLEKASLPIINLHPAKWGEFDGAGAIERSHKAFLDGKISETGVMIHYVSICAWTVIVLRSCR